MLACFVFASFLFSDHCLCAFQQMDPSLLMQIMAMSTMKDHERLELLKEIGGTKVYEERRKESLKILHETDNRRSRILEVVILELPYHAIRMCLVMDREIWGFVSSSGPCLTHCPSVSFTKDAVL